MYKLSHILYLVFISAFFSNFSIVKAAGGYSSPFCRPFNIYRGARLPVPPPTINTKDFFSHNWENNLLMKINSIGPDKRFKKIYKKWLARNPQISKFKRYMLLNCILYYVGLDLDKDGIKDWTAIVDEKPAAIIIPNDNDMDGDGIINTLDANPYNKKIYQHLKPGIVPKHLSSKNQPIFKLQHKLFKQYGILSISHTDTMSELILTQILKIFQTGFNGKHINLPNLKYIYFFKSHNTTDNIAAFHSQMKALSIGGLSVYNKKHYSVKEILTITANIAHELGHAFLLSKLSSLELLKISKKFGDWSIPSKNSNIGFYSKAFFSPHKLLTLSNEKLLTLNKIFFMNSIWKKDNIISQYALTNIHEWFAEAFAAFVINNMGKRQVFGKNWKKALIQKPDIKHKYWVNYANISPKFNHWLARKTSIANITKIKY